ncbi:polymorphic toxin-type HINT domain-containing protein [Micromonospora sediminimaris]|nr:polymorphic toxin-type HINT domain-containing protein [Micromonospora sediminimaris]
MATLLTALPQEASATSQRLSVTQPKPVSSEPVPPKPRPADLSQGAGTRPAANVRWPRPEVAEVDLFVGRAALEGSDGASTVMTRAGSLPVRIGSARTGAMATTRTARVPVSRARVEVIDHAAASPVWRDGLLLRIERTDGSGAPGRMGVAVDYGAFESAFGADWSTRLRLLALPECALSTPDRKSCGARQLPSRNDFKTKQVVADVDLDADSNASAGAPSTLLALQAASAGPAGDYGATPLQPSSSWSAGGSSGDFVWSYPVRVPPALGPAPDLTLGYSSSAVDGRSDASNNQPSWVGEGFDYAPGFIERRYVPCLEDTAGDATNSEDVGDLCWGTDNAVLSLNGRSNELVKDDASGQWRLKGDDASRVEKLTGADNGDERDGEYWRVTTADGVQYYFGRDDLPGHTAATASTNTVRVYGNHPGEPCYNSSFKDGHCRQAWRWNLDYVVDTHGGTMSLWYQRETNKYAANVTDSNDVSYIRASTLSRIDYGTWDRGSADRSTTPTAQVFFTTDNRCLSECTTKTEQHWPDVPWDQECTGDSCAGRYSPTFWSTKRLAKISTRVAGVSGDVETWTLTHTFPKNGDASRDGMWLESIRHAGHVGSTVSLPEINFDWVQKPNRVDQADDGKPPMHWMRLSDIWTETGGKITVAYSNPECVAGSNMPASPHSNTLRCYPVLSEDQLTKQIERDYFHKYVVREVTEADWTGGGTNVITSYEYLGGAAWHHTDDDGLTRDKFRTWADYRGYGRVRVRTGTDGRETLTETHYYRGMHGDKASPDGGAREVRHPARDLNGDGDTTDAADAPQVDDVDALRGTVREHLVYNGVDTDLISRAVNQGWQSAPTATRDMGSTNTHARFTGVGATWNAVRLDAGRGWRVTSKTNTFDDYGMSIAASDRGDTARTDDEQCLITTYARNISANIVGLPSRLQTFALPCGTDATKTDHVIADVRNYYDGKPYGAAPTKGDLTRTETLKDWSTTGGTTWLTNSTSQYDPHGRVVAATDIRGNSTTTDYTPATGGPVTRVTTTNHLEWTTSQDMSPIWGLPERITDANGKMTDRRYDALGRLVKVWLPNRPIGTNPANPGPPSIEYSYTVRNSGGVNATATRAVSAEGTYVTTYALFDGLARPRQTQSPAVSGGGTVLSETVYDSAGRVAYSSSRHHDPNLTPGTQLRSIAAWEANGQTVNEYDRAGRQTASILMSGGEKQWQTTTAYGGDRVYVTPPNGGTPTTTISDARGNTVEVRQHAEGSVTGPFDATTYTYNAKAQLAAVTDAAGNDWIFEHDIRGRQIRTEDPDRGQTMSTYNDAGDLTETIDALGKKLVYTYDSLGRRDATYDTSVAAANLRASWTYDPSGARGHPASSSRWTDGGKNEYRVQIRGYNALYQSSGEDYIIPASETGLAGTYIFTRSYKADGISVASATYPNTGGLGGEQLTFTYDSTTGLPEQVRTNWPGAGQYVANTDYTAFAELGMVSYQQTAQNYVEKAFVYDDRTARLNRATTIRQQAPQPVATVDYEYDPAGNITRIMDDPEGGSRDVQCFRYDYVRRLTSAWTPVAADCAPDPTTAGLGGPAPYWHSWTFDPVGRSVGNRAAETRHGATDTVSSYRYPTAGAARPHAATEVVTTGTGVGTKNYRYDAAGNTTCRPNATATSNSCPSGSGSQTLTWDSEGRLASVSDGGKNHSYLYDADGGRLIARDPTGRTLYLPGMEVRYTITNASKSATRYYSHQGQTYAMRQPGAGITWLVNDHQGTQRISITAGSQVVTQRRQNPYGGPRGSTPAWPNQLGFVGGTIDGTTDPTGLTHIGARSYDPSIGRFVSVDPLQDLADPQQWNGYAYGNNSPITFADPTGLRHLEGNDERGQIGYQEDQGGTTVTGTPIAVAESQPPTINDTLAQSVPSAKVFKELLFDRGYGGSLQFNWREMLTWAAESTHNWVFLCTNMLGGDSAGCEQDNPMARTPDPLEAVAFVGVLGGTLLCARTLPACLLGIAEGELAFAATGSMMGLSGGGLGLISLARSTYKPVNMDRVFAGLCSFSGDTEVLLADGSSKPISEVRVGDEVEATDPETGERGDRRVTHLWVHDDDLHTLEVGGKTLKTTEDHPFWNDTDGEWQRADALDPGDRLLDAGGEAVLVTGRVSNSSWRAPAFNLTVDNIHTYYVLAGNTPVLVHNSGCGPELSGMENFGKKWGKHSKDYRLNPGDASARDWFRNRIGEVRNSHDEVRRGPWNPDNGGGTDYWFYRKDEDLLVTRGDGTFVTMFPGASGNGWFNGAARIPCGCN